MRLTDFKVLTFDCYGTLIDWEAGILAAIQPLLERLDEPPDRDTVLEAHGRQEAMLEAMTPGRRYSEILASVYRRLAEQWDLAVSWNECLAYGRSIGSWPAFPDSVVALAYLRRHYRLVVLSNVDNASFAGSSARLGDPFHAVYTAEDIGSYKPDLANFRYMMGMLEASGVAGHDVLHVAESLFHDHAPANELGLASAWIHRRHDQGGFGATRVPEAMPRHDFRFTSMAALAEAHRQESDGAA